MVGWDGGKSEWNGCANTNGEGDCSAPHDFYFNPTTGKYDKEVDLMHQGIDNITACMHGYTHAWNKVCSPKEVKKQDIGIPCPLEQ
jgi:hypothetical protein